MTVLGAERLWDVVERRRTSAWAQQRICESAGVEVSGDEDANPREAWWHAQGRAEAFAEVMTLLEQAGADRPQLVVEHLTGPTPPVE